MKNLQTNLLGRHAHLKREDCAVTGAGPRRTLWEISGVFISEQNNLTVILTPCDQFGHRSPGAPVAKFLSEIEMS